MLFLKIFDSLNEFVVEQCLFSVLPEIRQLLYASRLLGLPLNVLVLVKSIAHSFQNDSSRRRRIGKRFELNHIVLGYPIKGFSSSLKQWKHLVELILTVLSQSVGCVSLVVGFLFISLADLLFELRFLLFFLKHYQHLRVLHCCFFQLRLKVFKLFLHFCDVFFSDENLVDARFISSNLMVYVLLPIFQQLLKSA